ncbi:hypothetical protein ACTA71_003384 [Dictyostelium dimigraforme]
MVNAPRSFSSSNLVNVPVTPFTPITASLSSSSLLSPSRIKKTHNENELPLGFDESLQRLLYKLLKKGNNIHTTTKNNTGLPPVETQITPHQPAQETPTQAQLTPTPARVTPDQITPPSQEKQTHCLEQSQNNIKVDPTQSSSTTVNSSIIGSKVVATFGYAFQVIVKLGPGDENNVSNDGGHLEDS